MKSIKEMNSEEIAAFVCEHLRNNHIDVVLSGGSCVSIYSENRYLSYDFDFIPRNLFLKRKLLIEVLAEIGFTEKNRYFEHSETKFLLEFPAGPLTVGDEPVKSVESRDYQTGTLVLLSATDCIKDRLTGYYHWKDRQCLEQATLVAINNSVDYEEIKRWSEAEGMSVKFNEIHELLFPKDGEL